MNEKPKISATEYENLKRLQQLQSELDRCLSFDLPVENIMQDIQELTKPIDEKLHVK